MSVTIEPELNVIRHEIAGKHVWQRSDLNVSDWLVVLNADAVAEIEVAVEALRAQPVPLLALGPASFTMPACEALMARVRNIVDDGVRFCLVRGLPIDMMSCDEAKSIYWILSSMVGRPVAQKLVGTMIYDVTDTGAKALPGSGVRPDKTNIDVKFHNDNAYNQTMPDVVGLLCIRASQSGGTSRVMSFATVYNELLKSAPDAIERLYQPFPFDRQMEFDPCDSPIFEAPMFVNEDGNLMARLGLHQVRSGYAMTEPMDPSSRQAIKALEAVFAKPELQFEFNMQPGDIQFSKNCEVGYSRTEFVDYPEADRKRLLVRMWLRDTGPQGYVG